MNEDIDLLLHVGLTLTVEGDAVYVQACNRRALALWKTTVHPRLNGPRLAALTRAARKADEAIRRARTRATA